jgi:hypothetical protein
LEFSILGGGLGELAAVALHAAASDVGWLVVSATLVGLAVIEGALSDLELDAAVLALALGKLNAGEISSADLPARANPPGLGVDGTSQTDQSPLFLTLHLLGVEDSHEHV